MKQAFIMNQIEVCNITVIELVPIRQNKINNKECIISNKSYQNIKIFEYNKKLKNNTKFKYNQ